MIRQAELNDVSRIAEILIFTKRMTYRPIFRDDKVSFGEMQVLPLAENYRLHPELLSRIWVYDEEFVKGLITLQTLTDDGCKMLQIEELYVDVFFHNEKIGSKLLSFAENMAKEQKSKTVFLWVLEKNEHARAFYSRHGFEPTTDRQPQEGPAEYIVKYQKKIFQNCHN